jgi:hypothetical protein
MGFTALRSASAVVVRNARRTGESLLFHRTGTTYTIRQDQITTRNIRIVMRGFVKPGNGRIDCTHTGEHEGQVVALIARMTFV